MNTKLTLSLDKDIISRAKIWAKKQNKSLSQIVEDYLKYISTDKTTKSSQIDDIPPITKTLGGILKGHVEPDFKNEIGTYITRKYK